MDMSVGRPDDPAQRDAAALAWAWFRLLHPFPSLLVTAAATAFGLHVGYIRSDVEVAFRRLAKSAHPDTGGTLERFQALVSQRDLLVKHLTDRGSLVEENPHASPSTERVCPF